MKIVAVVAVNLFNYIGKDNELMWKLPNDLKHFKEVTTGKPVIMGRKTFESIGKPLPGRTNIVVSKTMGVTSGVTVVNSLKQAFNYASHMESDEVCIIGGGEIYKDTFPLIDKLEMTVVKSSQQGDTKFPEINPDEWNVTNVERFSADDKNEFDHTFITADRIK